MRGRLTGAGAVALLAATAAITLAAPAAQGASQGQELIVTTRSQNLGGGSSPDRQNASFECAAAGVVAVNVSMNKCYLLGEDGLTYGEATTVRTGGVAVGTALDVPAQPYQVCAQAIAFFTDGTFIQSPLICQAA